jgi:hypothetical protein
MALSMFLTGNTLRGMFLLVVILLLLPSVHTLIKNQTGNSIPPLVRVVGVVAMVGLFGWSMSQDEKTSIYFTPQVQSDMMAIYDAKLAQWPTPYSTPVNYFFLHSGESNRKPLVRIHPPIPA